MSVTLTQSDAAAFPDRPVDGPGLGVEMQCSPGSDGMVLVHELGQPTSALHVRFLFAPVSLTGGRVVVLRGMDAEGDQTLRLTYDTADRSITLDLATGEQLAGVLDGTRWHCVELMVDASADAARLDVNSVVVAEASGSFAALSTGSLELGAAFKDSGLTGTAYIDEFIIDSQPIGPAMVAPDSEYADAPSRWLVIYNRAVADSVAWAQWYGDQRSIPRANLLGLDLPTTETISEAEFAELADQIGQYLTDTGLDGQVMGLLFGHGVPAYYTRSDGLIGSVIGQMQADVGGSFAVGNPIASLAGAARPDVSAFEGTLMAARIDAPSLAQSQALTNRAIDISEAEPGDGSDSAIWLDAVTDASGLQIPQQVMLDWSASVDRQRLRLPIEVTQPTDPATEVDFGSIHSDGFFIGWRTAEPPQGFFGDQAGRRVFCMQLDPSTITVPTLRDDQSGSWGVASLAAGYAAAGGSCRGVSAGSPLIVESFFDALRRGWTIAEAWSVARPALRDGVTLVGDPFMTVPMPRAGWNVYGPFADWTDADFSTPVAALRADETEWVIPPELRPASSEQALYVLRRVNEQGIEEAGLGHAAVADVQGRSFSPPSPPVWPGHSDWRPVVEADAYAAHFVWASNFADAQVHGLRLLERVGSADPVVIDQRDAVPVHHQVRWSVRPTVTARYCVEAVSNRGVTARSHWSAPISPIATTVKSLEVVSSQ